MTRLLAFCCLALSAVLPAQGAPCAAGNDANNVVTGNLSSVSGVPNVRAFLVNLPPTGFGYRSIQICTGNTAFPAGFMKLELWNSDPVTNLPRSRAAGGTWRIDSSLGVTWQGTNLDLDIVPFGSMWIVWTEPGLSTEPIEPGGTTFTTAQLIGSNWILLPQPQALKFRLFCQWLEQPNVTVPVSGCPIQLRGCACPTFTGFWGTLFTNQQPTVGNAAFALEGTGFPTAAPALLGLDLTNSPGSLFGLPAGCVVYPGNGDIVLGGTGSGDVLANWATTGAAGHTTFPLPIPPNPALSGLIARAQLAVYDARFSAPLPFSLSNGLRIVVQ